MGALDHSLGALIGGSWVCGMLYMFELVQMYRVWTTYKHDQRATRLILAVILVIDTFGTLSAFATVYLYCVTYWGQPAALLTQYWPISTVIVTTTLSAFCVQAYLISRFWAFSRNRVLTAGLSVLTLGGLASGIAVTVINFQHPLLADRDYDVPPGIVALALEALCDICLALSLVFHLRRLESAFAATRGLLHRLAAAAAQTGAVTSLLALAALAAFLQDTRSNVVIALEFALGRVYTLTLLYNLALRAAAGAPGGSAGSVHRLSAAPVTTTIHVQHDVQIHADDETASYPARGDSLEKPPPSPARSTFSTGPMMKPSSPTRPTFVSPPSPENAYLGGDAV